MKRFSAVMAPAFVLALALSAAAQEKPVTTTKDMDKTVKVTVTGEIQMDYVYRSAELTYFIGRTPPVGGVFADDSDGETTFEGVLRAGFTIDLTDKISGVLEFGTKRVDAGARTYFGELGADGIVLREARVNISEFLNPKFNLELGICSWMFDPAGQGSPAAFAPGFSSSATKNVSRVAQTAASVNGNLLDEIDPVGAVGTFRSGLMQLDVVLLPAIIEGSSTGNDEALYAVDFFYTLDEKSGSRVGGILAVGTGPGTNTSIFTLGGGITWKGIPNLDLYGEVYVQFGNAGQVVIAGLDENLDAKGRALQIGAAYTLQAGNNPVVLGAKITYFSGDGDDAVTSADTSVDAFVGYENINDLAILEDMWWGLDIDTNYTAFKIHGKISIDAFDLSAILGIVQANEDVENLGTTGTSDESAWGQEFDLKATWNINKQFDLHVLLAMLLGSDIIESTMDSGVAAAGKPASGDSGNSALLYAIGFDLKF